MKEQLMPGKCLSQEIGKGDHLEIKLKFIMSPMCLKAFQVLLNKLTTNTTDDGMK